MIKGKLILYTDGSYVRNSYGSDSGFWGSGCHGYIYNIEEDENVIRKMKKFNVLDKYVTTDKGYIRNDDKPEYPYSKVFPLVYLDGVYSYLNKGNAYLGELKAIYNSLLSIISTIELDELTKNISLEDIRIVTDNEPLLNITSRIIHNNIEESDINKNENYIELKNIIDLIKNKNIRIRIKKVKAHSGNLGNHLADCLAKYARNKSRTRDVEDNKIVYSSNVNYWEPDMTINPLLDFKQIFFSNNIKINNNVYNYAIMEYKSGYGIGEKTSNAIFGMVLFDKPIEYIENAIKRYLSFLKEIYTISTLDLKLLYNRHNLHYYKIFGIDVFYFFFKNKHMSDIENNNLCYSIYPSGLANHALQKMDYLYSLMNCLKKGLVDSYNIAKENNLIGNYDTIEDRILYTFEDKIYIDITDKIFKIEDTKKGIKYTILFNNKMKLLNIDNIKVDDRVIHVPIELGYDILSRNQLNRLKEEEPIILLVIEKSKHYVKYYTIIETDNAMGCYCNFYSGMVYFN